jgi:hypothetical protein
MNRRHCLILILAVSSGLFARAATAENPYTPIVSRNMFNLIPIPPHNPADDIPAVALPKITPNGIMTIFGKLQVLFKVTVPGPPPKEVSYVMGEGERQDEIEVQKIDEKDATITFNNHGMIQTLELSKPGSGGGPGGPAGPGGARPTPFAAAAPTFGGAPAGGTSTSAFGRKRGAAAPGNPNPGTPTAAPNQASNNNQPQQPTMSPEEQIIMMEANRMKALQEGDPIAKIIPPTELTPQTTGEGETNGPGGSPAPGPGQH